MCLPRQLVVSLEDVCCKNKGDAEDAPEGSPLPGGGGCTGALSNSGKDDGGGSSDGEEKKGNQDDRDKDESMHSK